MKLILNCSDTQPRAKRAKKYISTDTDLHDYNSLNQPKKDKKIIHTHTQVRIYDYIKSNL